MKTVKILSKIARQTLVGRPHATPTSKIFKIKKLAMTGIGQTKRVIDGVSNFMIVLQEMTKYIHEEIKKIETMTTSLDNEAVKFSTAYYQEFYPIRGNLRKIRLGLKKLATETIIMSRKVRIFFQHSERLGNKRALELQMGELEALINKSIPILKVAETEYRSALDKLEKFEPRLNEFVTKLNRLLNRKSNEYVAWTQGVRGASYGGAVAGNGVCLGFLAFGPPAFGKNLSFRVEPH